MSFLVVSRQKEGDYMYYTTIYPHVRGWLTTILRYELYSLLKTPPASFLHLVCKTVVIQIDLSIIMARLPTRVKFE
jgi:hypothetical protein